jgi:hypothetical protein
MTGELIEEIIEEIKELFNTKNAEFNVGQPEKTEDNTLLVEIDFKKPIKLTDEERDELYNLLRSLGFHLMNGVSNQVNDFIDYKEWVGEDEFENDYGDEVLVYYTEVRTGGKTTFFIDKIVVEENTQEYVNELY